MFCSGYIETFISALKFVMAFIDIDAFDFDHDSTRGYVSPQREAITIEFLEKAMDLKFAER